MWSSVVIKSSLKELTPVFQYERVQVTPKSQVLSQDDQRQVDVVAECNIAVGCQVVFAEVHGTWLLFGNASHRSVCKYTI